MFNLFRYGLTPIVLFCLIIIAASISVYSTTASRKHAWPQTVATVVEVSDSGQKSARLFGEPSSAYGTVTYVANGETRSWQGLGREIGVAVMNPGDQFKVYYNPDQPQEISTLVLLGADGGLVLLTGAVAFLVFYVWFFWLRGRQRHSASYGFEEPLNDEAGWRVNQTERSPAAPRNQNTRASFGKR